MDTNNIYQITMKNIIFIIAALFVSTMMVGQTDSENYIKNVTYQEPVQNQTEIDNLANDDKIETITYVDGFGRNKQTIIKQAGGNKQDIITPFIYDRFGRQVKTYLPFANPNQTINTTTLNIRDTESLIEDQTSYYLNKFLGELDTNNPNPYSEVTFEASPLNRVTEQGAPGKDWAIGSGHTIRTEYGTNNGFKIANYKVIYTTANTEEPELFFDGFYVDNVLYKTVTKDENWTSGQTHPEDHTTEEYKDKLGRVVLKRTFNDGIAHETQYVYDEFGNLVFVLSPKGNDLVLAMTKYSASNTMIKSNPFIPLDINNNPVTSGSGYADVIVDDANKELTLSFNLSFNAAIDLAQGPIAMVNSNLPNMIIATQNIGGGTYTFSIKEGFLFVAGNGTMTTLTDSFTVNIPDHSVNADAIDDLCYQYRYDYRNRLIEKKIPGKGWEYIVYDNLDRPVLTRDSLMAQNYEWLFTKYDAFGRVAYTGKLLNTNDTRTDLQAILKAETILGETHTTGTTSIAGTSLHYSNVAFPRQDVTQVLSVNYYDFYNAELTAAFANPGTVLGRTVSTEATSLPTGSKVRVLDVSPEKWITTVSYYDEKGRPVYVGSDNDYLGTTDVVKTELDFTGKPKQVVSSHTKNGNTITTTDVFTYDHAGRLLTQKQEIDGEGQELIVSNQYDELGQLENKGVGGETVFDGYTDIVGVSVDETTGVITKTTTGGWGNAGLATKGKFEGDGYVEWKVLQNDKYVMAGLSALNVNENFNTLMYAIHTNNVGAVTVREDTDGDGINEYIGYFGAYSVNDVFRVERSGTQILYKKNGTVIHTSPNTAYTGSLLGDVAFGDPGTGSAISDLKVVSSNLNTVLQTVDYSYNIRGWLKKINDVESLGNDLFAFGINYNEGGEGSLWANKLYNGNIGFTKWITANDNTKRASNYGYDAMNRITASNFRSGENLDQDINVYHVYGISYDKNGNLLSLRRSGMNPNNGTAANMDNLTYTYNGGNQLMKVDEAVTWILADEGFKDGTNTGDDYDYDVNGNMIKDENKGITTIDYNYLNLPGYVEFDNDPNKNITYIYDASGIKLAKVVTDGSSVTTTRYAGNYIYEETSTGEVLKFFNHAEGYTEPNGSGGYEHVYQYKDHLGNIRLSYSDANNDGAVTVSEIREENNYYPFGLKHKGYNSQISANSNSVARQFMFGGKEYNEELGLNWYDITARNYDPALGRWFVVDALADEPEQIDKSPYQYAWNNPIYYNDPDGNCPQCSVWLSLVIEGVVERAKEFVSPESLLSMAYPQVAIKNALDNPEETLEGTVNLIYNASPVGMTNNAINDPKSFGNTLFDGAIVLATHKASAKPSPKASPKNAAASTTVDDVVYRGDSRPPSQIFEEGFTARGKNMDLTDHAFGYSDDSGYISTSRSKNVATEFAGPDGYVYKIKKPANGVDVNQKLGNNSPFPWERELAIPTKIPNRLILSAKGLKAGVVIENPFANKGI